MIVHVIALAAASPQFACSLAADRLVTSRAADAGRGSVFRREGAHLGAAGMNKERLAEVTAERATAGQAFAVYEANNPG